MGDNDNIDSFLDRMNSRKLSGIGNNIMRSGSYSILNDIEKRYPPRNIGNTPTLQYNKAMSRDSLMEYEPIH